MQGVLIFWYMLLLLATCLGQALLTTPVSALPHPSRVAATMQTAAAAPAQPDRRVQAPAQVVPKKPASAKAAGRVSAIKLSPCDMMGDYDIPAQRFDETMQQIAHATGCGINTIGGNVSPVRDARLAAMPVRAVRGHMTLRQAFLMAIKGSAFEYVEEKDNILYVRLRK